MSKTAPTRLTFTPSVADMLLSWDGPLVVTGATGWVGQAILEMFDTLLGELLQARLHAFASTNRMIALRSGRQVQAHAFARLSECKLQSPIIFHCAFLTREHAHRLGQDEYVSQNRAISETMAAFIEHHGARSLFIPSSGAVYGLDRQLHDDLSRFPYAVLKLADEKKFSALGQRLGFNVALIRIFNLAGPFVNKWESYALASIITDTLRGGPIVLRANRPVFRSYAFVQDVVNLGVTVMLSDTTTAAFDTAGEIVVELRVLADRVIALFGNVDCKIIRPELHTDDEDRYVGDFAIYNRLATVFGITLSPLDSQIKVTATYQMECARRRTTSLTTW